MSIVITQENKIAWEKAIAKAQQVKPRVKVIGFGQFDVTGSKGETYRVEFKRNEHGEFEVSCSCKGHTGTTPKPCYHCPPCGSIFKLQVRERAAARSTSIELYPTMCPHCSELFEVEFANAPFICPDCEQPGYRCPECQLRTTTSEGVLCGYCSGKLSVELFGN